MAMPFNKSESFDEPAPELEKVEIPYNTTVFICGHSLMTCFSCSDLVKLGFKPGDIYVRLKGHMKCGVVKCGHCYIWTKNVCRDSSIFSYAQDIGEVSKRIVNGRCLNI